MRVRVAGRAARAPYEGADHVVCSGECPACSASPWRAVGVGDPEAGHSTFKSRAKCLECGEVVGGMTVTVSTIFGIEEDARVLGGRARVY